MGYQHELLKPMVTKSGSELLTHDFLLQQRRRNPRRYGQYLYSKDSNLSIRWASLIKFSQELHIGPEANSDAMKEHYWQFSIGSVRVVPVRQVLRW